MPGQDHQDPFERGRRVRLLSGDAQGGRPVPAVVLACAVHGVDTDIVATSPRSSPATASSRQRPTCSGAPCRARSATTTTARKRARSRGWRRSRPASATWRTRWRISKTLPQFNGRAATMGFCYGGPYAILGPKRLGYAAGISCHGSQMLRLHQGARRRHRSRSASSGATRTTARRRRCSTPIARCRPA